MVFGWRGERTEESKGESKQKAREKRRGDQLRHSASRKRRTEMRVYLYRYI